VSAFLSTAEGPSIEILDEGVLHRLTWLDDVLRPEERRTSIARSHPTSGIRRPFSQLMEVSRQRFLVPGGLQPVRSTWRVARLSGKVGTDSPRNTSFMWQAGIRIIGGRACHGHICAVQGS